jgi:heme exporter protein D
VEGIGNALHLGGYGIYVWPAFATAALVLCWMAVSTLRQLRDNECDLERLQHARGNRAAPGNEGTRP